VRTPPAATAAAAAAASAAAAVAAGARILHPLREENARQRPPCFHAPPLFPRPFSPHPQLKATNAERTVLQKKHGIRVVSREQAERIAAEQQQALAAKQQGAAPGGPQPQQ
jgi:hypothetical protein